jgi:hypothetical protein
MDLIERLRRELIELRRALEALEIEYNRAIREEHWRRHPPERALPAAGTVTFH